MRLLLALLLLIAPAAAGAWTYETPSWTVTVSEDLDIGALTCHFGGDRHVTYAYLPGEPQWCTISGPEGVWRAW